MTKFVELKLNKKPIKSDDVSNKVNKNIKDKVLVKDDIKKKETING